MKFFKGVVSVWTWVEVAVVAIVGCALQALLFVLTWPLDRRRRYVAGRFFRLMGVTAAKLAPTWRFRIHGDYPRRLPGRTVVVSNHVSHADCFLISHLPWEMKWLAKESLFKIPFIGWSMWLAGDIKVHRGVGDSIAQAMQQCARYLELGMPVCIFPEGTRSTTGQMLPFKNGAFRLAIETQSQLLPVAVLGTERALPKHSWLFGRSRAWVTVGEPIDTRGMDVSQAEELKAAARAQIEQLLVRLRALTPASQTTDQHSHQGPSALATSGAAGAAPGSKGVL